MNLAKIAVASATYAIDRPYDYLVPEELAGRIQPGMRVLVSFGAGNRRTDGIVLALGSQEPDGEKRKTILALLDDAPMLEPELLKLALWMREQYFCTVYDAARAMLPSGLWFSLKDCWKLADGVDRERAEQAAGRSQRAKHLVELLLANGGCVEMRQVRQAFGLKDPNPALRQLSEQGVIVLETSAARGAGGSAGHTAGGRYGTGKAPPEPGAAPIFRGGTAVCLWPDLSQRAVLFHWGVNGYVKGAGKAGPACPGDTGDVPQAGIALSDGRWAEDPAQSGAAGGLRRSVPDAGPEKGRRSAAVWRDGKWENSGLPPFD